MLPSLVSKVLACNLRKSAAGNGRRSTSSEIATGSTAKFSPGGFRAMGIRDRPTPPQSPWQNGQYSPLSEGCSLFFGLSLILRKLHPFADNLSARLVFFHFRGFSLGLNFLDQQSASASSPIAWQ